MAHQSEYALENDVIQQLENLGYERVKIRNTAQLTDNFRNIINERNADKLKGKPLSDSEFKRMMIDISDKSVFDSAMILRDKYVLTRDDDTKAYIELLDQDKWCKKTFQVTNQVTVEDKYKGRYDVTILINGLPLVQIELKRSGVAISEAFNQVQRYQRHNFTGLFKFIQMLIISNKMETRYLANSDKQLMKGYMFYWTDEQNNRINNLHDFIQDFLEPCHIAKMISRYMITNETDKLLMALRPYQVYAVENLLNQATETNNNGYVWHTTGRGKTLTSFKASQLLAKQQDVQKVIFLVDRKDLDSQTFAEFNKFQAGSVDDTENTRTLLKQLGDDSQSLIVTTIQKMAKAIKSGNPVMDRYQEDKVIFIIDECHRTQFGNMHKLIREHFQNAQYFGFTGTPRFFENKNQDGRATADIFGRCLHTYLIKDAIRDGNVLGFSVDYMRTASMHDMTEEEYVQAIDEAEFWDNPDRLKEIAQHIIKNYDKKTSNGKYTSILTVRSIPIAMEYYRIFQQLKDEGQHNLKIATVFTTQPNQDTKEKVDFKYAREELDSVMKDYNAMYDTNFDTNNYPGYFTDISNRMKKVVPGEKIDLLIVVDLFLTGFDSKKLNTLYVDRNLQYHGLIQAFSRTNRIETETKPYGNIVCFRPLKAKTDRAIELFSQTDNTDTVLAPAYSTLIQEFRDAIAKVFGIAPVPESVDALERESDQEAFVLAFRDASVLLVKLKPFDEFEFTVEEAGISEQMFEDYQSKYKHLYEKVQLRKKNKEKEDIEKVSILDDIDFKIEIMRNDLINVEYILDLISQINLEDKTAQRKDRNEIHKLLDKADDEKLRLKSDLIREFLDEVVPSLQKDADINEMYYRFEEEKKDEEIEEFASAKEFDIEELKRLLSEYEYSGQINKEAIDKRTKGGLLVRGKKVNQIADFIKHTVYKFTNVS